MDGAIVTLLIAILMIVAHIINAIRESAATVKQQKPDADVEELDVISRPKPEKQPKPIRQRTLVQQPTGSALSVFDGAKINRTDIHQPKKQALSRELSPQGVGQRFEVELGTLDTARIIAPTVDPSVKPELESLTGIYDEGAVYTEKSKPAVTLDIADYLTKPEGVIHAVILAEILNRPAWQETPRLHV